MNRKMELTWYAVSGIVVIALVLCGGCTGSGPTTGTPTPTQTPSQGNAVSIQNFAFVPPTLQVAAGTTVTWTNLDATDHQIINDATAQAAQGALFMSNPSPGARRIRLRLPPPAPTRTTATFTRP